MEAAGISIQDLMGLGGTTGGTIGVLFLVWKIMEARFGKRNGNGDSTLMEISRQLQKVAELIERTCALQEKCAEHIHSLATVVAVIDERTRRMAEK